MACLSQSWASLFRMEQPEAGGPTDQAARRPRGTPRCILPCVLWLNLKHGGERSRQPVTVRKVKAPPARIRTRRQATSLSRPAPRYVLGSRPTVCRSRPYAPANGKKRPTDPLNGTLLTQSPVTQLAESNRRNRPCPTESTRTGTEAAASTVRLAGPMPQERQSMPNH